MLEITIQAEAENLLEDFGFNQLPISLGELCNSISEQYPIEIQEQEMQSSLLNGLSAGDTK